MKALAWSLLSVTFVSLALNTACGSKSDDKETTAVTSSLTYSDVDDIISANCATSGCHESGSVNKPLTTLAEVKAVGAANMAARINSTDSTLRMPQNTSGFNATAEGKKLLEWLTGGADRI